MTNTALSRVMVYLQTHRDIIQADFIPLARLDMAMLPTKGDLIDVTDYIFSDIGSDIFRYRDQVLRVDSLCVSYQTDAKGKREIVSICGTAVQRPNFM